ncbi:MAG TPA: ribonuclease E/G [Clostridiales bacterium]|nr:MAG: hypothetical protein A2Y22_01015 [Clostridiales bacterium GWD2_32_59]HAN10608.1 ribonuclease E/G [Clostridiales bacterium]
MQKIIVNVNKNETQIAIIEDDKLVELYVENPDEMIAGNIYTGIIKNKLKSMESFFVDIGQQKKGFLVVEKDTKIKNKSGDTILVQVKKEETDEKGAYLTQDISINGKYMVLLPQAKEVMFSKKITSELKKNEVLELVNRINTKKFGVIVRNDVLSIGIEEIEKEYISLVEKWDKIYSNFQYMKPPKVVYKQDIEEFIFNNMVCKETIKVVINDEKVYTDLIKYSSIYDKKFGQKVELYEDDRLDIFDMYKVNTQIEKALGSRVWLKSGAELVFDKTEAMAVIDVDTSKFVGKKDKEQTIYKTNIEAAHEIARQIRIRNISGIIIVDFINMKDNKDKEEVLKILKEETGKDRIKTVILGITKLGLVEITRQKMRKSLDEIYKRDCPACKGKGQLRKRESSY